MAMLIGAGCSEGLDQGPSRSLDMARPRPRDAGLARRCSEVLGPVLVALRCAPRGKGVPGSFPAAHLTGALRRVGSEP